MFYILHIFLMALSVSGFIAGISAAIVLRKKKNWLKLHKTFNIFSIGGTAAGLIMAFSYVYSTRGEHIDGMHQVIGLTAFVSACSTLLLGFYQFKAVNKLKVRTAHRWLGRLSMLLLLAAIILGMILINLI